MARAITGMSPCDQYSTDTPESFSSASSYYFVTSFGHVGVEGSSFSKVSAGRAHSTRRNFPTDSPYRDIYHAGGSQARDLC